MLIGLLFAGGSRLFVSFYTEQQATYRQLEEDEERRDRELSENLTNYANSLRIFRYSPRTDGFLYSCKEEEMVNTIQYNVWNAGGLEIEQGMLNPLLDAKSSVDWTFIVSIFISFIALLFSYDSICGEKRDKVLGYLLSYPISRRNYWISKILSHISVVMLLLLDTRIYRNQLFADLIMYLFWIVRLRHDEAFECKSTHVRILLAVWNHNYPE